MSQFQILFKRVRIYSPLLEQTLSFSLPDRPYSVKRTDNAESTSSPSNYIPRTQSHLNIVEFGGDKHGAHVPGSHSLGTRRDLRHINCSRRRTTSVDLISHWTMLNSATRWKAANIECHLRNKRDVLYQDDKSPPEKSRLARTKSSLRRTDVHHSDGPESSLTHRRKGRQKEEKRRSVTGEKRSGYWNGEIYKNWESEATCDRRNALVTCNMQGRFMCIMISFRFISVWRFLWDTYIPIFT